MMREALAAAAVDQLRLVEAHGTGTPLGDPTELGGLEGALVGGAARAAARGAERGATPGVCGAKASLGHTEPTAGLLGLLALRRAMLQGGAAANARVRVVNPLLKPRLHRLSALLSTQVLGTSGGAAGCGQQAAGVSSFGYSGTIAHAVVECSACTLAARRAAHHLVYQRRPYRWRAAAHPFLQLRRPRTQLASTQGGGEAALVFASRVCGALRALVAEHVVQGRIVFPAAGYLEMASAASSAASSADASPGDTSSRGSSSFGLSAVFFLQPLTLGETLGEEASDAVVEVEVSNPHATFEVRSVTSDGVMEVHSAGALVPAVTLEAEGAAAPGVALGPGGAVTPGGELSYPAMRQQCTASLDVPSLYESFDRSGLQYGPAFRALQSVWTSPAVLTAARAAGAPRAARAAAFTAGIATLKRRPSRQGTNVHPADLDGALQLSVAGSILGDARTRLPFAVDSAELQVTGQSSSYSTPSSSSLSSSSHPASAVLASSPPLFPRHLSRPLFSPPLLTPSSHPLLPSPPLSGPRAVPHGAAVGKRPQRRHRHNSHRPGLW